MKAKYCEHCNKKLERKRFNGRLEDYSAFKRRRFCDRSCANRGRNKKQSGKKASLLDEVREATHIAEREQGEKRLDALEFLTDIFNDEDVDTTIRVTAAKAVAPYTHRKATDGGGKKEERAEKAKKASTGRFSPGVAPRIIIGKKS